MELVAPVVQVEIVERSAVVGEYIAANPLGEKGDRRKTAVEVQNGKAVFEIEEVVLRAGKRERGVAAQHERSLVVA